MSLPITSGLRQRPQFSRSLLRALARAKLRAWFGAALLLACACSSEPGAADSADLPSQGAGLSDQPGGACNVEVHAATGLAQTHVSACSDVSYAENPPAGGPHYPTWAAFQSYSFAVPRGFWVHDLEHGAVVYSYHCADGCRDEVAAAQAMIDALPSDPACSASSPRRVVLTPDPLLDARWAASAWGFTLRADCLDAERFRQFYLNHFALGPENFCNPGTDFAGVPPCE